MTELAASVETAAQCNFVCVYSAHASTARMPCTPVGVYTEEPVTKNCSHSGTSTV